ncbi:MAG: hypothetical protein ACRD2E_11885 [Terriglobales bacterium]
MPGDASGWRWVALAVEPIQIPATLAALDGDGGTALTYPDAGILRLYADGRQERIGVAQVELVLPAARIPAMLRRLRAAGVLREEPDRAPLIRRLSEPAQRDCWVLPAPPSAPYAHIVRWRRSASATPPAANP